MPWIKLISCCWLKLGIRMTLCNVSHCTDQHFIVTICGTVSFTCLSTLSSSTAHTTSHDVHCIVFYAQVVFLCKVLSVSGVNIYIADSQWMPKSVPMLSTH